MHLAGYIAKGKWQDSLIRQWTGGPVSHTEIVFEDGWWFTSSPRDGGVRFKRIDPKPGHWVLYDLAVPPAIEAYMRAWAEDTARRRIKYDMPAIVAKHGLHLPFDDPTKWICSESNVLTLQQGFMMPDMVAADTTPMDLIRWCDLRRYRHRVS